MVDQWKTELYSRKEWSPYEEAFGGSVYLQDFPGASWQERWDSCELNTQHLPAGDVSSGKTAARAEFVQAVEALFALRVIRPTLGAFRANRWRLYSEIFVAAEHDPALEAYLAAVAATDAKDVYQRWAVLDVCAALTIQGIPFTELTPEAFLHYAIETPNSTGRQGDHIGKYVGHLAWQVLHSCGQFPASAPPTLRGALRAPQLSITQMVEQYEIRNPEMRQLLIDYLTRRCVEVDYSSLTRQGHVLAKLFWAAVERINPEQADLNLSAEVYTQWRATVTLREDGTPRLDQMGILIAVRAMRRHSRLGSP